MSITIKKRKNWYAFILLAIFSLLLNYIVLSFIYAFILEDISISEITSRSIKETLIIGLPLILLDVYLIDRMVWQISGYEQVEVSDNTLIIKKRGKILRYTLRIPFSDIKEVEQQDYQRIGCLSSIWVNPFGASDDIEETGGRVKVTFTEKILFWRATTKLAFGLGFTAEKASGCVEQLKKHLQDYQTTER